MTRITDHVRHAIIFKMQEHTNIKKFAKDLHLCRSMVRNIWKKFLETGSISDKKKSGRPPLLSERGSLNLSMLAKKFLFCDTFDFVGNIVLLSRYLYLYSFVTIVIAAISSFVIASTNFAFTFIRRKISHQSSSMIIYSTITGGFSLIIRLFYIYRT